MIEPKNINIGERVRFLVLSSYEIGKTQFLMEPYVQNQSEVDIDQIVLGGEYIVLDKKNNEWGIEEYKLANTKDDYDLWQPSAYIFRNSDVDNCPFKEGQNVRFKPREDILPEDLENFRSVFSPLFDDQKTFKITKVLNSFYIHIDLGSSSFPFVWYHFEKT